MNDELPELVRMPREDLDIELKQWIDMTDKNVHAKLTKELLAFRNHGGVDLLQVLVDCTHVGRHAYRKLVSGSVFFKNRLTNIWIATFIIANQRT